ncbi:MAG: oxygenase MpaB family protein, partial [Candidatus Limnocylindrales bacterium]
MAGALGLYGPDSEAWRLNREAMLLLGAGPRALLMQLAHPLVAEGVDQHSTFRTDPWGRLRA